MGRCDGGRMRKSVHRSNGPVFTRGGAVEVARKCMRRGMTRRVVAVVRRSDNAGGEGGGERETASFSSSSSSTASLSSRSVALASAGLGLTLALLARSGNESMMMSTENDNASNTKQEEQMRGIAPSSTSSSTLQRSLLAGAPAPAALSSSSVSQLEMAESNGLPTLLAFYADWCPICRAMARPLIALRGREAGQVNVVQINVENPAFAEEVSRFRVRGVPHFVFLDGDGEDVGEVVGALSTDDLQEDIVALKLERALPVVTNIGSNKAPDAQSDGGAVIPSLSSSSSSSLSSTDPKAHSR